MSLDGFIAGPNQRTDNGLGDGGQRLHDWVMPDGGGDVHAALAKLTGANRLVMDEVMATGAVIAGRQTFEPAGGWGGDHHDGVPIYILSRHPAPDWAADWPNVHYTADLAAAVSDARDAAGDKDILVHGAGIARHAIAAGLLDVIEVHIVPVLLGDGSPMFELLGLDLDPPLELERIRVLEGDGGVTHLRYRVLRSSSS